MWISLKDTLKAFGGFKTSNNSVWSNVLDMETYIYSDSLFNTLYSEIKHKFWKKISFGQNKRHNKAFFFPSELQLITVLLLICNSYTSWSTRFISLNCMQGFLFSISSRFYWSLYFCSTKSTDSLTWKRHNLFKINIIEKPHIVLFPYLWFLSCNNMC